MPKQVKNRPGFVRRRQKFTTVNKIGYPFFFPWEDCFRDLDTADLYDRPVEMIKTKQSANLQQWQNSSGRFIVGVDASGRFTSVPPSGVTSSPISGTVIVSATRTTPMVPLTAKTVSKAVEVDGKVAVQYSDGSVYTYDSRDVSIRHTA